MTFRDLDFKKNNNSGKFSQQRYEQGGIRCYT